VTAESTKGKRKIIRRLCFVVISGILVVTAALICSYPNSQSIDEQLAAIEAARAIPDSKNAAILYDQLLQNPNASINDQSELLGQDVVVTRNQTWIESDYPKLAVWIKDHQWLTNELVRITQLEKCRFPLIVEPYRIIQVKRLSTMRKWAFFLCQAANYDIGEGRIDDAITKWQCLIQIGKHLSQQSQLIEYVTGTGIESMGIMRTTRFLAECNVSEEQLLETESFKVQTHDDWAAVVDRIRPVEEIGKQIFISQLSPIDRFKYKFGLGQFKGWNDNYQIVHGKYPRMLVIHRGLYIMVALRRYKNEHGRWPQSLDQIKPQVGKDILTDPHTNGPFVYKLTEDGFILYSKGRNGVDNGGRRSTASGTNTKSLKSAEDDILIWPTPGATK